MKIIIRDNAKEGSLWAAHYIAKRINEKAAVTDKPFVIGLCTGSTPIETYKELIRMVKAGEVVAVKKPPVTYSFKILKTIEQRVGAKLLPEIYENVTTPDQYELLEMNRISGFVDRARGTGRPTKKDRRQMDEFLNMEEI